MTDAQVRKLMEEFNEHGKLGLVVARAGLDRKTAAKYRDAGNLPSEMKARGTGARDRTRSKRSGRSSRRSWSTRPRRRRSTAP